MKFAIKILLPVLLLTALSIPASAQITLQGVYGTEIKSMGISVQAQLDIKRFCPQFDWTFFFKKNGATMQETSINLLYRINVTDRFLIYPLVGVTGAYLKTDKVTVPGVGTVGGSSAFQFGGNVGARFEYLVATRVGVNLQGRYSIVKDLDQAVFGLGVAYHF